MYDPNTASSRTSKKALPNEYELWTQITGVSIPTSVSSAACKYSILALHLVYAEAVNFHIPCVCSCCLNSAPVITLSVCLGREENWTDCSSNISTEQNNVDLPKYRRKKIPGKNASPTSLQMDICSQCFNDAIHPSVIQKEVKKLEKKIQGSISE